MRSIVLILTLTLSSLFTYGQRKKEIKEEVKDLKKIDSLIKPIPTNRLLFHTYIDDYLLKIDYLDGKYDNKLENYRGPETDGIINNDILRRAKHLANYTENETFSLDPFTNNNTKIKFLQIIRQDLVTFFEDIYDGKANLSYYQQMFDVLEDLMTATKENKVEAYVKANLNMGLYFNKSLIENDKALMALLIDSMCYKYPEVMEPQLSKIVQYDGACAIMAYMAKKSITRVLTSATSTNYERDIVRKCNDPLVKSINEIATKTKNPLRAIAFLTDFQNKTMSIEEIDSYTASDESYYKALVKLRLKNEQSNTYVVNRDIKTEALNYVRKINELHDEPDAVRFTVLNGLTAEELYYLGVLCNEEVYTSSFIKGIFKNLMIAMAPKKGDEFLESIGMDKYRTFIRTCANYHTLDTFLASMNNDKKISLMKNFVKGLGDGNTINMEGAVDVADCFGSINDPQLLNVLKEEVRTEYEANYLKNNKDGLVVYFILYTLFTSKDANSDDSLFNATLTNKLKMPPINKMPFERLVSANGKIYEQVFFYGDKDGKQSYNNFLAFIKKQNAFKIDESNEWFTKITTLNSKVPIEIYANKPLDEEKELDEKALIFLNQYLEDNAIEPTVAIHRGHSYHLPYTINILDEDNKVIILGSCGSYHNLSKILERSSESQMIASKQVGAMAINDPIIEEMNKSLMLGNDVNWVKIWEVLDKKFVNKQERDLFNDYVPPHKNLGALFLKAFKTLRENQL
jgi:hypothetical protein